MHRIPGRALMAALITLATATTATGPAWAQGDVLRWIEPYTGQRLVVDPVTQHLFVLAAGGSITTLNSRTGARLQQVTVTGVGAWESSVVDSQLGRAVLLASAGTQSTQGTQIVLLNTQTGTVLNTISTAASANSLVEDASTQRVYVSESDAAGTIAVVDAHSGQLVTTFQVGAPAAQLGVDAQSKRLFVVTAPPAGSGARDTVQMVDLTSQKVVGSVTVGHGADGLAVDGSTRHVFVTNSADRTISVIDGRNARLLTTDVATTPPSDVLVDSIHGRAYILCPGAGQPPVNGIAPARPLTVGATVDVLDTQSGTVLVRIPVRAPAEAMTVDPRTGYLFVATAYNTPVNMYLSTPYSLIGGLKVISTGTTPTVRTVLWPANTAPATLALDQVGSRIYSLTVGSTTTSGGTVMGFTAMLDETRL